MNPNYLEYDSSVVDTIAKFKGSPISLLEIIDTKNLYKYLVAGKIGIGYRNSVVSKVASHRIKRFIVRYNSFVDLVEDAKKNNYIGKYTKHCIQSSNGKKRVVFNPESRFKKLLKAFSKVLESVCFSEFSGRYKHYKIQKKGCSYFSHKLNSRKEVTPFRFVLPHKVSIDSVLSHIAVSFRSCLYPSIIKLDIKDAYQSTTEDTVRYLLDKRLNSYDQIYKFILDNISMCFINGKLPPGYPTSSVLFHFIKDQMLHRWLDKSGYLKNIFSYADDIFIVVDDKAPEDSSNLQKLKKDKIDSFIRYLRKWGYRINQKKKDHIPVFVSSNGNVLSSKMASTRLLGKTLKHFPTSLLSFSWEGTRKHKNKLRMLKYLIEKEKQSNLSSSNIDKDNVQLLEVKKRSFEDFYFPKVNDVVY